MLSPDYLAGAPSRMMELAQELEDFIIQDIARRISTSVGKVVTQSALHQLRSAGRYGLEMDKIQDEVARITGKGEVEICALFDDATREGLKYGNDLIEQAGGVAISPDSAAFQGTIEALRHQTLGEWRNITQSLGFAEIIGGQVLFKPVAKYYQDALDFALWQIETGAADYNAAIRQAVRRLCDSGLRTVDYASGWQNRVDVAARRAVMTGITQLSGRLAQKTASILGTSLMEITAHPGARPSHAVWQGKVVDQSGRNTQYLTLADIGYGEGGGFKGWNCRHDWYPFVGGISRRSFTDKELKNIDPPPFQYEGRTYTAYEATQQQRKLETAMRASKRKLIGFDAIGDQAAYMESAVRLRRQREAYRNFSSAAGLPTQNIRTQQFRFGRKEAAKATAASKKAHG